jgi:hypothetical protein
MFPLLQQKFMKLLFTNPTHFDHEDGGSMYLQNVGNTAHIHRVQGPSAE